MDKGYRFLAAVIAIVVVVCGIVIAGRGSDNRLNKKLTEIGIFKEKDNESESFTNASITDAFDGINFRGAWNVEVLQGDDLSVTFGTENDMDKYISWDITGGILEVEYRKGKDHSPSAIIVMPDLESVECDGALSLNLTGFHEDVLDIETRGGLNLSADNCSFDDLSIDVQGAVNIDLENITVKNADLDIDGASNIKLTMDGGDLDGEIQGVGRVLLWGEIDDYNLTTRGLTQVEHKE